MLTLEWCKGQKPGLLAIFTCQNPNFSLINPVSQWLLRMVQDMSRVMSGKANQWENEKSPVSVVSALENVDADDHVIVV